MINLGEVFAKYDNEFLEFDALENKRHNRQDLCVFLILDELLPGNSNIVSGADHDIIWLGVNCEKLSEVATEDDILELRRCGVSYDNHNDCLTMFV